MTRHIFYVTLIVALVGVGARAPVLASDADDNVKVDTLREELKSCGFRIICESYRDTNWELMVMDADGSHLTNLTKTPAVDEMYPHASPDGTKVVFLTETGEGKNRMRDVYFMNTDGTGRTKVAEHGRQPFWSPDGKVIAFARGTKKKDIEGAEANSGLYFYNIETRKITQHQRRDMGGLLNPCWSSNGKWIISTVMQEMDIFFSICALEVQGTELVELRRSYTEGDRTWQCRPDLSPDGRHISWGKEAPGKHMWVEVGDIDLNAAHPKVTNRRYVVTVDPPHETYHVDWSPNGRYIAFSQGTHASRMGRAAFVIGSRAKGWNIRVVDPSEPEVVVQITKDGLSYKEPDWFVTSAKPLSGSNKTTPN